VDTKTITLPEIPSYEDHNDNIDTRYDVSTSLDSSTVGKTSAKITLGATQHNLVENTSTKQDDDSITIKVDSASETPLDGLQVSVSGDVITLTGKATDQLLGLIRAFASLSQD
jgi:hypothetical protein